MKVSVIIVSYNTKNLTSACIKSVVKKTKDLKYEVIIVDNASTDGSVEEIKKLQKKFINLRLLENRKNLGFAKANNQAIRVAKGEYVLLLNSDTLIVDGAIKKLVDFAESTSDAGVVGPRLENKDRSIQGSVFRLPTPARAIKQYWLGGKNLLDKYYPKEKKPQAVESVVMASFLITPKARDVVGLLEEKYFMYFEDLDYCKRVWGAGLKVYYLPDAEVIHYHGASGKVVKNKNLQKERLSRSSVIYHGLLKHFLINFIIWSGEKCRKLSRK